MFFQWLRERETQTFFKKCFKIFFEKTLRTSLKLCHDNQVVSENWPNIVTCHNQLLSNHYWLRVRPDKGTSILKMKACENPAQAITKLPDCLCPGHSSCLWPTWATTAEFSSSCLTLSSNRSAHLLHTEVAGASTLPIFHLNEIICQKKKEGAQR